MTAGRTYLSIGDVLTLLRQEFPDVTISKIRFLESQGLVNPERTPSGYRKFYDHDVERLRWVLRQQREHFLPLKVIKGRLEDETSGLESSLSSSGNGSQGATGVSEVLSGAADSGGAGGGGIGHGFERSTAVGLEERRLEDRRLGDRSVEVPGHLPGFDPPAGGESLERHLAGEGAGQSSGRPLYSPTQGGAGKAGSHARTAQSGPSRPLGTTGTGNGAKQAAQGMSSQGTPQRGTHEQGVPQRGTHEQGVPEQEGPFGGGLKAPWAGSMRGREPSGSPLSGSVSGPAPAGTGAHASQVPPAAQVATAGRSPGVGPSRKSPGRMTLAEIAAAAGLTESAIEELESYGILSSRMTGGEAHFDESELTIARVAADFAKFGIEPRHLRLYKHASEREAGFVEQLVLPLLKQRNPEARKRATEMVTELTRLGEGLRSAIVRRSLQDFLGE
jgi:DNA-binding transcriptional MerR regulator